MLEEYRIESNSRNECVADLEFPPPAPQSRGAVKRPVWVQKETFPELKTSLKTPQLQSKNGKPALSESSTWGPQKAAKPVEAKAEADAKKHEGKKGGRKKKWAPVSLKNIV
jgi:hypothetical protein